MQYEIDVRDRSSRPLAAVRERMAPSEIPKRVLPQLTRAYAAMKRVGMSNDGQNVFIYWPAGHGLLDVDTGVGVAGTFAPEDELIFTQTPAGESVCATHWGDYAGLGGAHAAIREWCAANGRETTVNWEVYGHWTNDPAALRTDVYYLLKPGIK